MPPRVPQPFYFNLASNVPAAFREIEKKANEIGSVTKPAKLLVEIAKEEAPVHTGRLRDSIRLGRPQLKSGPSKNLALIYDIPARSGWKASYVVYTWRNVGRGRPAPQPEGPNARRIGVAVLDNPAVQLAYEHALQDILNDASAGAAVLGLIPAPD